MVAKALDKFNSDAVLPHGSSRSPSQCCQFPLFLPFWKKGFPSQFLRFSPIFNPKIYIFPYNYVKKRSTV